MFRPYILEYAEPIETVRKCEKCNQKLGSQNPGYICDNCKFLSISYPLKSKY